MRIIDGRVRLRTEQLLKTSTTELKPYFKDYIKWYNMKERLTPIPVKEQIKKAAESGIEKMVVCGGNEEDNKHILSIAESHSEIIPVAGVSIDSGINKALSEIKRCSKKGIAAINISPFISKINANDKKLYPIYGLCELLGKPIIVHGSMHYWRGAYMCHGHPMYLRENKPLI